MAKFCKFCGKPLNEDKMFSEYGTTDFYAKPNDKRIITGKYRKGEI